MTARQDDGTGVTYYGDAPIRDREGYTTDVGIDRAGHVIVKNALDGTALHGVRADHDIPEAEALRDRLDEAIHDAKEKK